MPRRAPGGRFVRSIVAFSMSFVLAIIIGTLMLPETGPRGKQGPARAGPAPPALDFFLALPSLVTPRPHDAPKADNETWRASESAATEVTTESGVRLGAPSTSSIGSDPVHPAVPPGGVVRGAILKVASSLGLMTPEPASGKKSLLSPRIVDANWSEPASNAPTRAWLRNQTGRSVPAGGNLLYPVVPAAQPGATPAPTADTTATGVVPEAGNDPTPRVPSNNPDRTPGAGGPTGGNTANSESNGAEGGSGKSGTDVGASGGSAAASSGLGGGTGASAASGGSGGASGGSGAAGGSGKGGGSDKGGKGKGHD